MAENLRDRLRNLGHVMRVGDRVELTPGKYVPALTIIFEFEGEPKIVWSHADEETKTAIANWIASAHPRWADLLVFVGMNDGDA
jgi:hypothetical protein